MTDLHQVQRLRIRPGPGERGAAGARMFTEVAHRLLARELDEALRGLVGDDEVVEVAGVRVRLAVDPHEADERTLAVLWAGLIRAEVERALASSSSAKPQQPDDDARTPARLDADRPDAPATRAAELAAVLAGLLVGATLGPADLRSLAVRATDDAVTVEALALVPGAQRRAALDLLRAAGAAPAATLLRSLDLPTGDDTDVVSPQAGAPDKGSADTRTGIQRASGDGSPAEEPPVAGIGSRPDHRGPQHDHGPALTSYGGLVLLHHRLRPLLERATEAAPHHDEVAVRLDVLAALVRPEPDPDGPRPVREDPLVRLLAGDPGWPDRPTPSASGVPVDGRAADDVLRSFAGDLPGFAASTPDFLRFHWIDRRAFLVADEDAVLLRLERRPLDLVLDRLPYPIGALRLPWTPTLLVGWEGA